MAKRAIVFGHHLNEDEPDEDFDQVFRGLISDALPSPVAGNSAEEMTQR